MDYGLFRVFRDFIFEKRKERFPIIPHVETVRVFRKIVVRVVFQNEDAVVGQQVFFQNKDRDRVDRRQRIGRPGEDVIEPRFRRFDELEHVHLIDFHVVRDAQFFHRLADELDGRAEFIDVGHVAAAARTKFIRVRAGAAEQVEALAFLKIELIVEDIEQGFF